MNPALHTASAMHAADLSPIQVIVLHAIHDRPRCSNREIVALMRRLRGDPAPVWGPQVHRAVVALVERGLVHLDINPTDRRINVLTLTGTGHGALLELEPAKVKETA